jgi:FkbM family methyltransferase
MWDIAANVGLNSCYAEKARATKVFAFEPSIFSLQSLARNIHINDLASSAAIIRLPPDYKLIIIRSA